MTELRVLRDVTLLIGFVAVSDWMGLASDS